MEMFSWTQGKVPICTPMTCV